MNKWMNEQTAGHPLICCKLYPIIDNPFIACSWRQRCNWMHPIRSEHEEHLSFFIHKKLAFYEWNPFAFCICSFVGVFPSVWHALYSPIRRDDIIPFNELHTCCPLGSELILRSYVSIHQPLTDSSVEMAAGWAACLLSVWTSIQGWLLRLE